MTARITRKHGVQQVADSLEVDEKTVRRWIQAGCPHTKRKDKTYRLDDAEVASWLHRNQKTGQPGRPKENGTVGFEKIRERKELAMAENWEIRNAQLRGELLPADEVKSKMVQHIREARAGLEGLGAAIAPALVGMAAGNIQVKIDERISDILRRLSASEVATD